MIIDLPETTTREVNQTLVDERGKWGAIALGRVLTLVIDAGTSDPETAIAAANSASRQNPSRIIVLSATGTESGRLDAQIRVGSDAGAGEVVVLTHHPDVSDDLDTLVLPLLLPDAPVVAWWPGDAPSAPAKTPIGALAQRRVTSAGETADPVAALVKLSANYTPGDTDLAWTRTTVWRGLIAAALDRPPFEPVTKVTVTGERHHPSVDLLAAWLGLKLGCPVEIIREDCAPAITQVRLDRGSGPIIFSRPDGKVAELYRPGAPLQTIPLPIRSLGEAVAEELRTLGEDGVYGEVLAEFARTARPPRSVLVLKNTAEVEDRAADALFDLIARELRDPQKVFHLGLTGGGVGIGSLRALARRSDLDQLDWKRVHLWWGDERFLAHGDPERNETQAREALLDSLVERGLLTEENIHPMAALTDEVKDPGMAAKLYAAEMAEHSPAGKATPNFDVLLLGMGPDGHVASLFPDLAGVSSSGVSAVGVWDSPKPPPLRVSLSFEAIEGAKRVWLLAAGAEKADAIAGAQTLPRTMLPAAGATGIEETIWWLDEGSALGLADSS